ncbi:MAG: hypothetical protein AAF380_02320 [Bacteroidota bacterium]
MVPLKIWEKLLDELEMYEDVKLYDESMKDKRTYTWEEVQKRMYAT